MIFGFILTVIFMIALALVAFISAWNLATREKNFLKEWFENKEEEEKKFK